MWLPIAWPADTISRISAGSRSAHSPIRKNVALASWRASNSIYTALPVTQLLVDGDEPLIGHNVVFGWNVTSTIVVIPPGETVTVAAEVTGYVETDCALVTPVPAAGGTDEVHSDM